MGQGSNAVAHRVQTVTQPWSSFTAPAPEAKTIYQLSVNYSISTIGTNVVRGTNELCIVVVSNTSKLLHLIQDGGGDRALQHMNHFCFLMFLFTFVPEVLFCCTSSEWDRVWARYRRPSPAKVFLHISQTSHLSWKDFELQNIHFLDLNPG